MVKRGIPIRAKKTLVTQHEKEPKKAVKNVKTADTTQHLKLKALKRNLRGVHMCNINFENSQTLLTAYLKLMNIKELRDTIFESGALTY